MAVVWRGLNGFFDGVWNDPDAWVDGFVPQDGDTVVLPDIYGGYTITISTSLAGVPFVIEADGTADDPITIAVTNHASFVAQGIGQLSSGARVQLSQSSSFQLMATQGAFDPTFSVVIHPVDVSFADGTASEFIPTFMGPAALHSPTRPDFYTGTISGFGGRNTIRTATIGATSYFAYSPAAGGGGGTLTLYQPGLDPFYDRSGELFTEQSGRLAFSGSYSQSDFRLTYGADGFGLLTYVAQSTTATGPNIVQGTAGDDTLAVQGRFKMVYGNGGNDRITVTGDNDQVLIGNSATSVERVTLTGTHDIVQGSGGDVTVRGGTGSNTYILGDGATATARYDVAAGGAYNKFVLDDHATNVVVAGGSGASVAIGGAGDGARGSSQVALAGINNVVNIGDGDATVTGGDGYGTLDFGAGSNTIALGGQHNRVMVGAGASTIDPGSGNEVVTLNGTNAHLTLHGSNNMVFLGTGPDGTGASGTIDGSLMGLRVSLGAALGDIRIVGYLPMQRIYFNNVPAGDAATLTSDGAGGTVIYTGGGSIDFVGAPNVSPDLFSPYPRQFHG